ncbi:MAG TPA: glycosyltransferase family 39 protein [Thermoanaerobaculia bacterium]|nr:glycosyltransferase family 39 protein [Thermoanaerobaculia bacterium]
MDRDPLRGRRWGAPAAVVALTLLATALRLHRLTFQSLWFDELFGVVFSHPERSLAEIVAIYATDFHPLLYPLLLHAWMELLGATELAARLLSALAGIASIPAMYGLGWALGGRGVGLAAALLTAVNPFHVAYSQEARSYTLLFLFAALSFAALLRLVARPRPATLAAYVLAAGLALHTHYYGLVLAGAQLSAAAAVILWRRRAWRALAPLAAAAAALALLCLPWLRPLLRAAATTDYWPPHPGPAFAARYFHLYFGAEPWLTALHALLLLALPVLLLRRRPESSPAHPLPVPYAASLLAAAVVLGLAAPYAWSLVRTPILLPRCTIVLLPALLGLVALAVGKLPGAGLRGAGLAAVLVGSLLHLFAGGYYRTIRNEQWREAARWAARHPHYHHPRDRFVAALAPAFQFYFDQDAVGVAVEPATAEVLREALAQRAAGGGVWFLETPLGRRGDAEFQHLLSTRFHKVAERRFHGALSEYWVPRE